MRTKLVVENRFGSKKPFLYMTVHSPKCRLRIPIKAFIDTGCPHELILNSIEARRMQFKFPEKFEEITRLGGHKIKLYSAGKSKVSFKDEHNKIVKMEVNTYIAAPTTKKEDKQNEVASIPNILGVEFLEINKCTLIFCPHKDYGILTDEFLKAED